MNSTKTMYFIFIPAILIAAFALFIRIVQYQPLYPKQEESVKEETQKTSITLFADDIISGNKKASKSILIFKDLGCAQCKTQSQFLDQLLEEYPDKLNVIWKLLAVTKFPESTELAHDYTYCANQQGKFDAFKTMAYENTNNLSEATLQIISREIELDNKKLATCLASEDVAQYRQKVIALAKGLNIQAVPTIFINDTQIRTPRDMSGWITELDL